MEHRPQVRFRIAKNPPCNVRSGCVNSACLICNHSKENGQFKNYNKQRTRVLEYTQTPMTMILSTSKYLDCFNSISFASSPRKYLAHNALLSLSHSREILWHSPIATSDPLSKLVSGHITTPAIAQSPLRWFLTNARFHATKNHSSNDTRVASS